MSVARGPFQGDFLARPLPSVDWSRSSLWLVITALVGAASLALVAAPYATATVAHTLAPASWGVALPETESGVAIDRQIEVTSPGWLGQIQQVQLYAVAGNEQHRVPLRPIAAEGGVLRPAEGETLLQPDRDYRLVVSGSAFDVGIPLIEPVPVVREVQFSTVASPRPQVPAAPVYLNYGEQLTVEWNVPVFGVQYEVTPQGAIDAVAVGSSSGQIAFVPREYEESRRYQITITDAVGPHGAHLQDPYSLSFVTPTFPSLLPATEEERVLKIGDPLPLWWNVPIRDLQVIGPPHLGITAAVDDQSARLGMVTLQNLEQGKEYVLTVSSAEGTNHAPLREPQTVQFKTPPPLMIAGFGPDDEAEGVGIRTNPSISFSDPVEDREAVERAFQIEPAVPGTFVWESPTELVYELEQPFDYETRITVSLEGGPDAFRSAEGGYLEEGVSYSFVTQRKKSISVNLSRQMMYLHEGDEVVFSTPVATGVRGAETPTGTYEVLYKMEHARFRGTNPSGRTYDIPDVPWVLPFWGDYAIHGAPWRSGFGSPGSNGCVSLPAPADKFVYDWAPVGTPIHITD